jgi:hypothetical protein
MDRTRQKPETQNKTTLRVLFEISLQDTLSPIAIGVFLAENEAPGNFKKGAAMGPWEPP